MTKRSQSELWNQNNLEHHKNPIKRQKTNQHCPDIQDIQDIQDIKDIQDIEIYLLNEDEYRLNIFTYRLKYLYIFIIELKHIFKKITNLHDESLLKELKNSFLKNINEIKKIYKNDILFSKLLKKFHLGLDNSFITIKKLKMFKDKVKFKIEDCVGLLIEKINNIMLYYEFYYTESIMIESFKKYYNTKFFKLLTIIKYSFHDAFCEYIVFSDEIKSILEIRNNTFR